ncbi:LamG-like jellyroll fold domain-containing protein [Streptacidiphilus sp. EB129]|uniref:LamG-like jellyroll fold domain-containing protein n=1 Tax=Streptacidiphilus sp. EB129 TaxID=3156262 RepID=UPI0035132901
MRTPSPLRRTRGVPRRIGTVAALTALVLGGSALPALADPIPADGPVIDATPVAGPDGPAPTKGSPTQLALIKAKATGTSVPVPSLTTSTSTTVANPDGSLSSHTDLKPVRLNRAGTWVPLDATLAVQSDGTLAPAATTNPITLSGGGTGTFASLTDPAGHTLALTLPFSLPTPTISGNTAQYGSVLPGVDLVAKVDPQGGFSEVLVVHSAQAATNPDLQKLVISTQSVGLTLHQDASGLTATAPDGSISYTGPVPLMWDSTTPAPATAPAPSTTAPPTTAASAGTASRLNSKLATTSASDSASATPTPTASASAASDPAGVPVNSSTDAPGSAAQVAPIAVATSSNAVTLTPDQSLLTSATTQWPVYVDPPLTTFPSGNYTQTYSTGSCSTYPQWNTGQPYGGEGVGYMHWDSTCGWSNERSYFTLNTSSLASSMVILAAKVHFDEPMAAACNSTVTEYFQTTGAITPSTVASNAPAASSGYAAHSAPATSGGGSNCAGGNGLAVDVKADVQQLAGKTSSWTFRLVGNETQSTSNNDFARFSSAPTMDVTYDIAPYIYGNPTTNPNNSANPYNCGNNGVEWLGATSVSGGSSNIYLQANVRSSVSGTNVRGDFDVWDTNAKDSAGQPLDMGHPTSSWLGSGNNASVRVGFQVQDGHWYGWGVQADDNVLKSPWTTLCHFAIDTTQPTSPTIAPNPTFPPLGSPAGTTPAGPGVTTSFTVTATDPQPSQAGCTLHTCIASGINHFIYQMDAVPTITASTSSTGALTTNADGSVTTTITNVAIPNWGPHTLWFKAVDAAGNPSANATGYTFNAPWDKNARVTPGDINGDALPDLLSTSSSGDLTIIPGGSPITSTPLSLSKPNQSPDTSPWTNYLVAHRGSFTGQRWDDLYAFQTKTKQLYAYNNDLDPGGTGTVGFTKVFHTIAKPPVCETASTNTARCTGFDATSWGGVTQMVAPGAVYGNYADLITVENGRLWLYRATSGGGLASALLLGSGDWSHTTLITPGTVGGIPSLWARDNTTGILYSYTLPLAPTTSLPPLLQAPGTSATGTQTGAPLGATISPTTYPIISSPGDVNGPTGNTPDGKPDLYITNTQGQVSEYFGIENPGTAIDNQGPDIAATHQWKLDGGTITPNPTNATDSITTNPTPATLSSTGTSWQTNDTDLKAADTSSSGADMAFDGSTGYAYTGTAALNTTQSYTVSAWVKLAKANTVDEWAVGQGTNNHQAFYLGYNASGNTWAFVSTTTDTASTSYPAALDTANAAVAGAWTHLVGVYDVDGTMALYVNGTLVATAVNNTPSFEPNGHLTIGAISLATATPAPYGAFNGSIADVRIYDKAYGPTATLPASANTALGIVGSDTTAAWQQNQGVTNPPTPGPDADTWALTGPSLPATDQNSTNTLNDPGANTTFDTTGPPANNSTSSAMFNGTTAFLTSSTPAVNTQGSFSISLWADDTSASTTSALNDIACQGTSQNQSFCIGSHGPGTPWFFQMASSNDTTAGPIILNTATNPDNSPTYGDDGNWDHLVATYDAPTATMTLYVNGQLAGTATNTTPQYDPTMPLTLAASTNTPTAISNPFTGDIGDLHTYPYALPTTQATSLF